MRGMPYTKASRKTDERVPTNSFVQEALALQAANRAPREAPKAMPITPKLPRMAKRNRRKRAG